MNPGIKRLDKNDSQYAKTLYATICQGDFTLKGANIKAMNALFLWLENLPARIDETLKPAFVPTPAPVETTPIPIEAVEEKPKKKSKKDTA